MAASAPAMAVPAASTPLAASKPRTLLLRLHLPTISPSFATLSLPMSSPLPLLVRLGQQRPRRTLAAIVDEEQASTAVCTEGEDEAESSGVEDGQFKLQVRPCELYVCNLPRSVDISELLELFKPFGTVQSVEISRNSETGLSKGCGYVTMSSIMEAKAAIAALDGSDLGGREIRVKYSVNMVPGRKNIDALNTSPKKDIVFESPHKIYVGNLSWSVTPEDLREHFSQFGTVVSTRLLHDRKGGKNRVYGFLSFSSADELKVAVTSSGSEFHGRTLMVREVVKD